MVKSMYSITELWLIYCVRYVSEADLVRTRVRWSKNVDVEAS